MYLQASLEESITPYKQGHCDDFLSIIPFQGFWLMIWGILHPLHHDPVNIPLQRY